MHQLLREDLQNKIYFKWLIRIYHCSLTETSVGFKSEEDNASRYSSISFFS